MMDRGALAGRAEVVAPTLLGAELVSDVGGVAVRLRLLEVEAYTSVDPASHSFRGITKRNATMFARPGTLYVYRSYGVHWCANVVTGEAGDGAAVLIRGGEVIDGLEEAVRRRGRAVGVSDGPGKVCQALGINAHHNGLDLLGNGEVRLEEGEPVRIFRATRRIGITKATELEWRFLAE